MNEILLEKWRKIYLYANRIAELDPWSCLSETDTFVLIPKGKRAEHYYCFLQESCDRRAIAFYDRGLHYMEAKERLHGTNSKQEPVFWLQDAVIFILGDREDVSKENYALIKALDIKCRGRGAWPFFEEYRVGYAPRSVPDNLLDTLLDDLGNLWVMTRMVLSGTVQVDFPKGEIMLRYHSPADDLFYSKAHRLTLPSITKKLTVTMDDNEWLRRLRHKPSQGTIALDWSYLPTTMIAGKEKLVPRLLLAVDTKTGVILKSGMLPPAPSNLDLLFDFLNDLMIDLWKPAAIEVCDREIESYISDLCQRANIRLVYRKHLKYINAARKELLKTYGA